MPNTIQYPCPEVQQHNNNNNGAFDLNWMTEHVKACKTCKQIANVMRQELSAAIDEATNEPPRN